MVQRTIGNPDYNNDGYLDIYLIQSGKPNTLDQNLANQLYQNNTDGSVSNGNLKNWNALEMTYKYNSTSQVSILYGYWRKKTAKFRLVGWLI